MYTLVDIKLRIRDASTPDEYAQHYAHFVHSCESQIIVFYFNNQWHSIKEEWVEGYKQKTLNFGTRKNIRIECFFLIKLSLLSTKDHKFLTCWLKFLISQNCSVVSAQTDLLKEIKTSVNICCPFYYKYHLPCRHLFGAKKSQINLYS